ncbi:Host cell factor [Takifugu flavidus]|uniref:Host cell factor n=1 Tax=Takifugu flavidus TaxID=433684 RepID=A0A5C6NJG8_9TELE|nr:Host cell factor [Takifugu flavidus]
MLVVSPDDMTWEEIPQNGYVPSAREGHSLCVVKGKLYLFGGTSDPRASECLPGVYSFDIVSLIWECLAVRGVALTTLRHSSAVVGDNIYVYGGLLKGNPTNDLMVFNTVALNWTPVKTGGWLPPALSDHSFALVGEQLFMFGGYEENGDFCRDLHVLNSVLHAPLHLLHVPLEDIYLFGGKRTTNDGTLMSSNELHKLSIAKMKWKVPLYIGVPPAHRHGHTAFIFHSHLFVFGGKNEEQEFNDLKVMKLINPSERQPVMKEILSEFGLRGVSHSFTPTKVPNIRYELSQSPPFSQSSATVMSTQVSGSRDFVAVRDEALKMIHSAFNLLDQEFQNLDGQKAELAKATAALQREREAQEAHKQQQKQSKTESKHLKHFTFVFQELQEMIEKHRSKNEAWLRARAEENDRERRELCSLREEVLQQQERLKEEQRGIQQRSKHLLSIMQQFKGL